MSRRALIIPQGARVQDLIATARSASVEEFVTGLAPFVLVGGTASNEQLAAWTYETAVITVSRGIGAQGFRDHGVWSIRKARSLVHFLPNTILVGRSARNDIAIDDHRISKLHARIYTGGGSLYIDDAGSINRTWVEGRLLEPKGERVPLHTGNHVRLGDCLFRVFDAARFHRVLKMMVPTLGDDDALDAKG